MTTEQLRDLLRVLVDRRYEALYREVMLELSGARAVGVESPDE